MSKGKKRSGARAGRPQQLRGPKGRRKGARLWHVVGQQFYSQVFRLFSLGYCMSNIYTGAERMPNALFHLRFLAEQIGRLIPLSTVPVIAGDTFEMASVDAI